MPAEPDSGASEGGSAESPPVACYRTRPERLVFVEVGSEDAWVATDVTVECER